jgi:hypothetical protein
MKDASILISVEQRSHEKTGHFDKAISQGKTGEDCFCGIWHNPTDWIRGFEGFSLRRRYSRREFILFISLSLSAYVSLYEA